MKFKNKKKIIYVATIILLQQYFKCNISAIDPFELIAAAKHEAGLRRIESRNNTLSSLDLVLSTQFIELTLLSPVH